MVDAEEDRHDEHDDPFLFDGSEVGEDRTSVDRFFADGRHQRYHQYHDGKAHGAVQHVAHLSGLVHCLREESANKTYARDPDHRTAEYKDQ